MSRERRTRSSASGMGAATAAKCEPLPPSPMKSVERSDSSTLGAADLPTSPSRPLRVGPSERGLKRKPASVTEGDDQGGDIQTGFKKKLDRGRSENRSPSSVSSPRKSPRKLGGACGSVSRSPSKTSPVPAINTTLTLAAVDLDVGEANASSVESLPSPPSPASQLNMFHSECSSPEAVPDLPPLTPPKPASGISPVKETSPMKSDSCLVGDVVWARVPTYPWWPAMLSYDPNLGQYRDTKNRLHVQFFGERVERAWIASTSTQPFHAHEQLMTFKDACPVKRRRSVGIQRSWSLALRQATEAVQMDRFARRDKFTVNYDATRQRTKPSSSLASPLVSQTPCEVTPDGSVQDPHAKKRTHNTPSPKKSQNPASANGFRTGVCSAKKPRSRSSSAVLSALSHGRNGSSGPDGTPVKRSRKSTASDVQERTPRRRPQSHSSSSKADLPASPSSVSDVAADYSADPSLSAGGGGKDGKKARRSVGKYWLHELRVCPVCERDTVGSDDVVACTGAGCGSKFHLACLGMCTLPADFNCDECTLGVMSCGVCRTNTGELKTCASAGCLKKYHADCLRGFPAVKWPSKNRFICPLHTCGTCNGNTGRMDRCARCPAVFHSTQECLQAGYRRLNETSIICLRHQAVLPPVHLQYCYECGHTGTERLNCAYCPQSIEPGCLSPAASAAAAAASRASSTDCAATTGAASGAATAPAPLLNSSAEEEEDNTPPPEPDQVPQQQTTPKKSAAKQMGPTWVCSDCKSGSSLHFNDIVHCKIGKYRWWPAKIVDEEEIPENLQHKQPGVGHFLVYFYGSADYSWTHKGRTIPFNGKHDMPRKGGVKSDAYAEGFAMAREEWANREKKMKPYEHIKTNVASTAVMDAGLYRKQKVPACMCTAENPCSESSGCLNYVAHYECDRSTCPVGDACKNRRLQQRKGRRMKIISEGEKGYGVRCEEEIKAGEFVIEYTGEVMLEEEFRKRLSAFLDEGEDACFYFMRLGSGLFLDAGLKGNNARFINHSCSPNLYTEQWVVQGRSRIGLFALKDIHKGDELSFDYQLDCCGVDRFTKCLCGAPNCSGYLGIRPKNSKPDKPLEKKKKKPKKARKPRKRSASEWEDECFECSEETGDLVMCDYPKCPKVYHLKCLHVDKVPNGAWWCPYHVCDICATKAVEFCSFCSSSCCVKHPEVLRVCDTDMVCSRHDEFQLLKARERKP